MTYDEWVRQLPDAELKAEIERLWVRYWPLVSSDGGYAEQRSFAIRIGIAGYELYGARKQKEN